MGRKARSTTRFGCSDSRLAGPNSTWSKANRAKALELIKSKRIKPLGLAAVEGAKRDGRWEHAYTAPSTATVPEDLQDELDKHPRAATFFATLNRVNRYLVLHRIHGAKAPATRARRITTFVAMLGRHEKLNP